MLTGHGNLSEKHGGCGVTSVRGKREKWGKIATRSWSSKDKYPLE